MMLLASAGPFDLLYAFVYRKGLGVVNAVTPVAGGAPTLWEA